MFLATIQNSHSHIILKKTNYSYKFEIVNQTYIKNCLKYFKTKTFFKYNINNIRV